MCYIPLVIITDVERVLSEVCICTWWGALNLHWFGVVRQSVDDMNDGQMIVMLLKCYCNSNERPRKSKEEKAAPCSHFVNIALVRMQRIWKWKPRLYNINIEKIYMSLCNDCLVQKMGFCILVNQDLSPFNPLY